MKKILSLILVVAMIACMFTVSSFAATEKLDISSDTLREVNDAVGKEGADAQAGPSYSQIGDWHWTDGKNDYLLPFGPFAASGTEDAIVMMNYNNFMRISKDIDLSKYTKMTVTYSYSKGADVTGNQIGFFSKATKFGQAADQSYNTDGLIAAGELEKLADVNWDKPATMEIDLSEVDYKGELYISYYMAVANGVCVSAIEFTLDGEDEEPSDPGEEDEKIIVSEAFWEAKLTVGDNFTADLDYGSLDAPTLQADLLPGKYVTHVSYDEVRPGIICGQDANGDKNITLPIVASGTKEVTFWGWLGTKGEIQNFAYSVNDGELQIVDKYEPTESAVVNAAMGFEGTTDASRYLITVPVDGDGTYVVKLYANVAVEKEEEPSEPTDDPSDPTDTPSDPTDTPSEPTDKPANPGTGDNAAALFVLVLMGAAAVLSVAVVMKKKSYEK